MTPLSPERIAELRAMNDDEPFPSSLGEVLDAYEALRAERDDLAAHELEVAQAVGVSYEADGVASAPGPRDTVLEAIADYRRSANELIDLRMSARSDKCQHEEGAVICADCAQDVANERDRYRAALDHIITWPHRSDDGAALSPESIARRALAGEVEAK